MSGYSSADSQASKPSSSDVSGFETSRLYRTANWLLSNRLNHSLPTIKTYVQSDLAGKLFGIGYVSYEGAPASIERALEMDFMTLLFRHGIVGLVLYLIPLLYFLFRVLKQVFVRFRKVWGSIWYCTYLYGLILGIGIAFFAGHV